MQIASTLLQFPSRYTNCENFSHVGIYRLRRHIRMFLQTLPSDDLAEDSCVLPVHTQKPVDRFDNYRWRGENLKDYTFFEYCMVVQRCSRREASSTDYPYDERHPNFETYIQRVAKTSAQIHTVCLHGQLSEFQEEEETVKRGHAMTAAIRNDLAEVLPAFFVPWEKLHCSRLTVPNIKHEKMLIPKCGASSSQVCRIICERMPATSVFFKNLKKKCGR